MNRLAVFVVVAVFGAALAAARVPHRSSPYGTASPYSSWAESLLPLGISRGLDAPVEACGASSGEEESPSCNCYFASQGVYDCKGSLENKACLPNTPNPPYLCQYNTAGCDFMKTQPCDGWCYYFEVPDGPGCEAGTWDPQLVRCIQSPIAVDPTGEGIRLTGVGDGVLFDMGKTGRRDPTAWTAPGSGTAWLAMDRDGDGAITSAQELFSNVTEQRPGGIPNGFLALVQLDENQDHAITFADPAYSSLLLWLDANHDGVSEPGELRSLADFGITRISLRVRQSSRRDGFGNELRYFVTVDPIGHKERLMWDIVLANRADRGTAK